ncbi:unnamed protein product, partial [Rotaria socialis]
TLVTGGFDGSTYLSSCEVYDSKSDAWTLVASMSKARAQHTLTSLPSGELLVTGGINNGYYMADCEMYDPSSNIWTPIMNM